MSEKMLGDLTNDNQLTEADVIAYENAVSLNNSRTIITYDVETEQNVMNDVVNGGLTAEQSEVVSLHQLGFASDIDRRLLNSYVNMVEPRPASLTEYINSLDTATIIPPVDPEVHTLEEYRQDVVDNILDLKVYMADVMLELLNSKATSLNDMRAKVETLWGDAYRMDYDSIAQLDSCMITGQETEYTHANDSGWKELPSKVLDDIVDIIENRLDKSQLEEVRDRYWTPSAITFSDPPTQEERQLLRMRIWSIPVESGIDFYDNYKNVSGTGGGGGEPSESLIPADPDSAPTPSGGLLSFINNCQETFRTAFTTVIERLHPNQIITVKATGSNAEINCYEVYNDDWVGVTNLTNISGKVGSNGVHPISEIRENTYASRTPAGPYRLGNYTTNPDDVGAFGNETRNNLKINYKKLTGTMHWIDAGSSPQTQVDAYPSWYNTFIDTADNPYHLIQWKRDDWSSDVFYTKDGTQVSGATTPFEYGKYYASFSGVSAYATEVLNQYASGAYRNAIVIRFNMPPHVAKPITPSQGAGAGSAYFLHSFSNDGSPTATAGCVAVSNENMVRILEWIDRTKSPYIFIGL